MPCIGLEQATTEAHSIFARVEERIIAAGKSGVPSSILLAAATVCGYTVSAHVLRITAEEELANAKRVEADLSEKFRAATASRVSMESKLLNLEVWP